MEENTEIPQWYVIDYTKQVKIYYQFSEDKLFFRNIIQKFS